MGKGGLILICVFSFISLVGFAGAAEKKLDWQTQWEKTLEAAEREGQVVLYASNVYEDVFREFSKRYPKINVVHFSGLSLDIIHRLMSERRAHKYLADLTIMGGLATYNYLFPKALDRIKPLLILPEVLDESKWWKGKHLYVDEEKMYIVAFNEAALPFVGYNTKQVNPGEIRSYWDLLQPRWKGKISALDPAMGSAVETHLLFMYYNPKLGPKYLTRLLGEMDLVASRDRRQISDWLATGKFALSVFTSPSRADLSMTKAQGLPVNWFGPKDIAEGLGTSLQNGSIGLVNRAPHPNAAKVAINWLLSREGQIAYQRLQFGSDSLRVDIPKDNVAPHARRIEGAYYMELDNPEWRNPEPIRKILATVWNKRR